MNKEKSKQSADVMIVILKESVKSFLRHNNFEMSVALASYGFFSIIPLLFFIAYLFGNYPVITQPLIEGIESLIAHVFPHFDKIMVKEFYFSTNYKITWGFISLIMILYRWYP